MDFEDNAREEFYIGWGMISDFERNIYPFAFEKIIFQPFCFGCLHKITFTTPLEKKSETE